MRKIFLLSLLALVTLTLLVGCAGRVYAPRDGSAIWYYHPELPEAAKAVEDAQKAGKDTLCPEEFQAAKHLMEEAYRTYWVCHTQEGINMAKEATAMAKALCPSPPPPAPKVIDRLTLHVHFDFDKSDIRKDDEAELQKAVDFVKKYPGAKVRLEGHTDSKGTPEYNQKLSERRAEAVKQYLVKEGAVESSMISAKGYGETRPIAPNKAPDGKDNPEGRAENRRVEILIMSE